MNQATETKLVKSKPNWAETQERFKAWWGRSKIRRPLMLVPTLADRPGKSIETSAPSSNEDAFLNVERRIQWQRNDMARRVYLSDNYPSMSLDIGPGSFALYLGCQPEFAESTIWFKEFIHDWKASGPLVFDPENPWWKRHYRLIEEAVRLAKGEFLINIPDLVENVDILSAMRGPQAFCFDLIDEPEVIHERLDELDELYFRYYNPFYDLIKGPDGSSSFTAFQVWGPGRTAKVQCDFCAMMSPTQFREFVQPSLQKQCDRLDHSIYHLDGPDAIRHLDALMEIDSLDALQWTPGAGEPDGGAERWFPIYEKVRAAGKSLWIALGDGSKQDMINRAEAVVKRFGSDGLYLLFWQEFTEKETRELLDYAEKHWG